MDTQTEPTPRIECPLQRAVLNVMGKVRSVQKVKVNNLPYKAALEETLLPLYQQAFIDEGLTIRPVKMKMVERREYTTSKGTAMVSTVVSVRFELRHASGVSVQIETFGEGSDSSDKSTNKAMTCALKYALRESFLLVTGDDPDKEKVDRGTKQTGNGNKSGNKPQEMSMERRVYLAGLELGRAPDLSRIEKLMAEINKRGFATEMLSGLITIRNRRVAELQSVSSSNGVS